MSLMKCITASGPNDIQAFPEHDPGRVVSGWVNDPDWRYRERWEAYHAVPDPKSPYAKIVKVKLHECTRCGTVFVVEKS